MALVSGDMISALVFSDVRAGKIKKSKSAFNLSSNDSTSLQNELGQLEGKRLFYGRAESIFQSQLTLAGLYLEAGAINENYFQVFSTSTAKKLKRVAAVLALVEDTIEQISLCLGGKEFDGDILALKERIRCSKVMDGTYLREAAFNVKAGKN